MRISNFLIHTERTVCNGCIFNDLLDILRYYGFFNSL